MINKENLCEDSTADSCTGRRDFIVKTSATAGGLFLTLAGLQTAEAQNKKDGKKMPASGDTTGDELVLKLTPESPLSKVGGSETVSTASGKVIIIHTSETNFVAYTAKCTHSGGPLKYDEATKQMACPWHGSRFDTAGNAVKGPAKTSLAAFGTQNAVVLKLKS